MEGLKRKHRVSEILEITLGVIVVTFGFYFFFSPANLVTGGVTGLSIIFKSIFSASPLAVSIFIYVSNIVLLVVGGLVLGKEFFFKTVYGTLLLPTLTFLLALFHVPSDLITRNFSSNVPLISAVSGAIFTGVGLGLVFKNNATTGGTDVIQKILYNKTKIPYSLAIYITDGIAIVVGMFVFGIELGFYAIVALLLAGLVVDRLILAGRSGYTVFVVTDKYSELKEAIYLKINRGVTKISVVGGYSERNKDMIVCTITRSQLYYLKAIIEEIDSNAFTFITKTTESVGQGFSK